MSRIAILLLASVSLVACGNDHASFTGDHPDANGTSSSGLPCDVAAALASCTGCHGRPLSGGAPVALQTYADLVRTSPRGGTIADRSILRMQDATARMPPPPASPAPSGDLQVLQDWVAAGMPMGDCGADNPFDQPPQCTSGRTWTLGDQESPLMHPGVACIACHRNEFEAPQFSVAGTVYPTGHEPNDCFGATGATVVITGSNGATFSAPVNSAGNFYLERNSAIVFPIRAKVVSNGQERIMVAPQMSGDCNSCHSQAGAQQAPGRVVVP